MPETVKPKKIVFYDFPPFLCAWLIIVPGFLLAGLHYIAPQTVTENVIGAIWVTCVIALVTTNGIDIDARGTISLILVLVIGGLAAWILSIYGVPVLSHIMRVIGGLNFKISAEAMLSVSSLLGFFYIVMLLNVWINHRWEVTPGFIQRSKWFWTKEEQIPIHGEHRITHEVGDLLEWVFCMGAGTLHVPHGSGRGKPLKLFVMGVKSLSESIQGFEALPVTTSTTP
ncbi:MAG: hypothetical protein G01um101425_846 [Candidatus Peregrinibacteria bacterium Gr01-1014_25]|nr:MAG: hypothetical protein G01um101425_846 [Candidatus Peregrinibacteria bacterium Gr01-1014_25]